MHLLIVEAIELAEVCRARGLQIVGFRPTTVLKARKSP